MTAALLGLIEGDRVCRRREKVWRFGFLVKRVTVVVACIGEEVLQLTFLVLECEGEGEASGWLDRKV